MTVLESIVLSLPQLNDRQLEKLSIFITGIKVGAGELEIDGSGEEKKAA